MTKTVNDSVTSKNSSQETEPVVSDGLPVGSKSEGLLTRAQAAATIGISITELRRREADGRIRPRKRDTNGWYLFAPEDVAAQANGSTTGRKSPSNSDSPFTPEEAANVFDAFDAGKTMVQCVRDCKVMPAIVRLLAEEYASLTGAIFLSKRTVDAINVLPLEGNFPLRGEHDLLAVMTTAASDVCKSCGTRARTHCKPCGLKLSAKAERNAL